MVINISKDGERLTDLSGRVIRKSDAAPVYELIRKLNAEREEESDRDKDAQA